MESAASRAYRLPPEGVDAVVQRWRRRKWVLMLVVVGPVLGIMYFASQLPVWLAVVIAGFVAGIYLLSWRQEEARVRATLSSFEVILAADSLARKQLNTPVLMLARGEISWAEETPKMLVLRPRTGLDRMAIFREVEYYDDLKERISQWLPIRQCSEGQAKFRDRRNWIYLLILGTGMGIVFFSSDRAIVVPVGLALSGYLIWGFWVVMRSRMVDRRTKRLYWFVVLPLFSILAKVYVLWSGSR